jgi:hypothetical protein
MKKIIPLLVLGILVISSYSAVAVNDKNEKEIFEKIENVRDGNKGNVYSHTILGEFSTATWCGHCWKAHGALINIYAGQWHPFYYISLVDDENTHAASRNDELGVSGYPTVFFDGGYRSDVGAGSVESAQNAYNGSIEYCADKEVNDVDIDLDVTWNGNAEMDIDVSIDNNENYSYSGHLHVYVTEIVSSMGWEDTSGALYTFPFLDYAYNQDISISSGGTWQDSKIWDGHDYNNGHGEDFGDISYGNIMIIATVFNSSDDYADDTTGYRIGDNDAPNTPSDPDPENGDTDIIVETDISWKCDDPDYDVLSYDVYFGDSSNPPLVASDVAGTSYNPGLLDFNTKYYWKIVAKDTQGASTAGPTWYFTTKDNNAPNSPSDPDPENGETDIPINTCIKWTGDDPDGDDVTYDVYFGKHGEDLLLVSSNQTSKKYCPDEVLEFETQYDWKIIVWDIYGYSTVGPAWYFTTEANAPPYTPSEPDPEDGETDVPIEKLLRWTGGDPNAGDVTYYDVYFGTSNPPPLVEEGIRQSAYDPGILELDTTYYWQIISEDTQGEITTGPIWQFTTEEEPNQNPSPPDIDGPPQGSAGTELCWTFHSDDPDNNDVRYIIDWGDGNNTETDYYGQCNPIEVCHTYLLEGTYIITAIAEDTKEARSDESIFEVIIPRTRATYQQIFLRIFERVIELFPILKNVFGLL